MELERFSGRRVLVTGGLGFIGSSVCHQLDGLGADVLNLDARTYAAHPANVAGLNHVKTDVLDIADASALRTAWAAFDPEFILHLAAESHVDRSIDDASPFVRTNVEGTMHMLECLRRHEVEGYVHVSTDEVYGDIPMDGTPVNEDAPIHASSPYSATKAAADLMSQAYARTYGLSLRITRGSNTYGPRQFPEKLIPVMLEKAARGESFPLYGDGTQRRDWLYVDDHAAGIMAAALHAAPGATAFNIGFGNDVPNHELLDALLATYSAATGADLKALKARIVNVTDRPGHDRRYAMHNMRALEVLGWTPKMDLAAGLRATVDWYRMNSDWMESIRSGAYRNAPVNA